MIIDDDRLDKSGLCGICCALQVQLVSEEGDGNVEPQNATRF